MSTRICLLALMALLLWQWPHTWTYLACLLLLAFLVLWDARQTQSLWRWARHPKQEVFPDAPGRYGNLLAAVQKVFRKQQLEKEQIAHELMSVKSVLSALPESVVMLDAEQQIVWANRSAERLLGIKLSVDSGSPLTWLNRDSAFADWLKSREGSRLQQVLRLNETSTTVEHLRSLNVEGKTGASLLISRDITETVKADSMRKEFVANVSHELRTPLTVLCANIETLLTLPLSQSEQVKILTTMSKHGEHMSRMVADLLILSRLDSGRVEHEEWLTLPEFLAGIKEMGESLSQGQHHLSIECAEGLALLVSRQDLHIMLANLVGNAVHYTPSGSQVRLQAVLHKDACIVAVIDNGPGIAPEHLPRLTERFYRAEPTRSQVNKAPGGTGLGLAIVKNAAARYGGRLEIKSSLGKGSEFRLLFPHTRAQLTQSVIKL